MDVFKIVKKLIDDDTQEMERIRRAAPDRLGPDRAHRFVQLYNRVDAFRDVLGWRRRYQEDRKGKEVLVVVAGPNPPEALTLDEVADVLAEFETSECGFWARTEAGGLEAVWSETTDSVRDETFLYFTSTFRTVGPEVREIGTCSWSRRRPT